MDNTLAHPLSEGPESLPPPAFTELSEVASIGSNGSILFATDDWFAPAEWMLKDEEPVFLADRYTSYGKWMDGWETRRKRMPGHDWCLVELGAPTQIAGFMIDTAYFTGNYVPRVSIQGGTLDATMKRMLQTSIPRQPDGEANMGTGRTVEELGMVELIGTDQWDVLLPRTELKPGYKQTSRHYFAPSKGKQIAVNHLRVNLFPDGGIARLRVYGTVKLSLPDCSSLCVKKPIDMVAMVNGGRCIGCSNAHYGHPRNLIKPSPSVNMGDGWETARRLDRPPVLAIDDAGILQVPGCEWAIFQVGAPDGCWIERVCIDTKHFKGNFPDNVRVEYSSKVNPCSWIALMEKKKLGPDRMHEFEGEELLPQNKPAMLVRITIAPDGGLSRVRIFGTLTK